MKLSTPEIVWHNKEPIFTADFHKNGPKWRLATGGGDNDIKVWKILRESSGVKILFLSNLSRHTKAVNIVRFSPNGEYLASAGDDNVVFLWTKDHGSVLMGNNFSDTINKENWTVVKILRGHLEDIYDLSWSCDSCQVVTGSVDNSAIVWDVQKGQQLCVLKDSKQYVQGVSWDPLGKFVVTLSNDRNLRIYGIENKFRCLQSTYKLLSCDQDGELRQSRMWIDERLNSFFRRLCFTPDGSFLIVPAGRYELGSQSKNATYVFSRNDFSRPVLQLPGPEKPTVVVKCCPVPFELMLPADSSVTLLPYRMVYAVASLDSILFYDTQHSTPFAHVANIHYSGITDMAWSDDGLMLLVTSSDCYCSIVTFEPGELGIALEDVVFPGTPALPGNVPANSQHQTPLPSVQGQASDTTQAISRDTGTELQATNTVNREADPTSNLTATPDTHTNGPAAPPTSSVGKPRRIRPTMIAAIDPDAETSSAAKDSQVENRTEGDRHAALNSNKKVPRRVDLITLSK